MTAFSDETGRGWLPLKYEDGPDFCTVTFATGAAFALTVHPERMKLMEAALSASPVETITVPFNPCLAKLRDGEPFFVLIGRDKQAPNAVMTWARDREAAEGPSPWVEQAREVAATMAAYSGAAPVAQEPVAWVEFTEAGLIRFWTSDPARAPLKAWNTRTPDPESAVAAAWEEAARVAKDRWREWRTSYEDDLDGMDACEDISKAISARASAIRAAVSKKTADGEITSNVGSSLSPKPDQGGRAVIELEEIARASNWKLVDGTMTTGESVIFDGSFIIAKVTRREDAELILALLSRDKLQS